MPNSGDDIHDEDLLYMVAQTDRKLFEEGMNVKTRAYEVPSQVMKDLGYRSGFVIAGVGTSEIFQRIESAFNSIYRKRDLAMGGHIGMFMYRDIFARFSPPMVFGQVKYNPWEFVDLTRVQLRIIQTEPDEMKTFIDQFVDVSDIQDGISRLNKQVAAIELAVRYIDLARLHLHAASAILTGGYDYRGAVQSALLASELALKAGAAAHGKTEDGMRTEYSHRTDKIADFIGEKCPSFEVARVKRVLAAQPQYVVNRYSKEQPGKREVGLMTMGAQFLVAEVVRQISDTDNRKKIDPTPSRFYPA